MSVPPGKLQISEYVQGKFLRENLLFLGHILALLGGPCGLLEIETHVRQVPYPLHYHSSLRGNFFN